MAILTVVLVAGVYLPLTAKAQCPYGGGQNGPQFPAYSPSIAATFVLPCGPNGLGQVCEVSSLVVDPNWGGGSSASVASITQPKDTLLNPVQNAAKFTLAISATPVDDMLSPGCLYIPVILTTTTLHYCELPPPGCNLVEPPGSILPGWPQTFTQSLTFAVDMVGASAYVALVDPVPDLLNGNATKSATDLAGLPTKGRVVFGVAADGVTELVLEVQTTGPGHQFQLTLLNDNSSTVGGSGVQSNLPDEDGALGLPGNTAFSQSQLTVTAGSANSFGEAYAFAVYRAPIDFARPNGAGGFKNGSCSYTQGSITSDDQSSCRSVFLKVQDLTQSGSPAFTVPINIVRPPVILLHGLWATASTWNNFSPLVGLTNTRFHDEEIGYSDVISSISTDPIYPPGAQWFAPRENSLGYEHNAPVVIKKIAKAFETFKLGDNPPRMAVAAVQADFVTHSFGGVIARTLPLTNGFFNNSFGQGLIHKLITLETPHLGSPLAAKLLDITNNTCTRNRLAKFGMYSFNSVTSASGSDNGAVKELQAGSAALNAIAQSGPHPLPAALVAGYYTNWTSLDCTNCFIANLKSACPTDLLAQSFNSTGWPLNFGPVNNNANDGIVAVTSQLNGPSSSTLPLVTGSLALPVPGIAHGPGIVGNFAGLSFTTPSALDAGNPIANAVVNLLNTPVNQGAFSRINP